MQAILDKIVSDAGRLLGVEARRFNGDLPEDDCTGFTLIFEQISVHLAAMPDDDTVAVSLDPPPSKDPEETTVAVGNQPPWSHVLGARCRWAWQLTNQRGYTDGLRFEFETKPTSHIIEMVVWGSTFAFYAVRRDG